ncbi:unnamed protein product (macronuclear) [Paramecium tetraurelia]|uniref:B box-type domain-containing protein n=1 Tax=Paramecium tetraurelia TaxID=5888 RepID=A0BJH9_PARTE|nr:uncharacterized protein GSPATT00029324001 [Paramecium tetraurelia]CAK58696.1 unnamed protein product [Paramecium tetraurelia]|eukprot:XP_001426094.1 hypothetical protein (macronuclear) [Paramecium tetraurelia strain d4-2]
MFCYQCHWQQHREHTPYNIEEVHSIAKMNCNKQIRFIELIIQKNTQEQNKLQDFLESQKVIYLKWNDQQKKSINGLIEKENQKLNIKIKELQSVLNLQNLDLILNNCLNKAEQYEVQYQNESQQQEIERQLQIKDIEARINFIKDLKFSISDLSDIFFNLPQTTIPKANEKAANQYKICVAHSKPQKYLCTHKDCLTQNSTFPFYCETCLKDAHKEHDFKSFAKKYKAIKQDQDEKTLLITQEQEKIKQFMQKEFNKNYELIQQQLKEKMNKYEKIKNNMSKIKEQSIDYLNKLNNFIFIENNINVSLLSKTIEGIKQEYQFQYKSFSQKMSIDLQKESREILTFSAQIDQKIEQEYNNLKLELNSNNEQINKLQSQLNQNQQVISKYSNMHNQLYLLQDNQKTIQQKINELTRNIKEKLNISFFIGYEREYFKSFDNDFKLIQDQISKTDIIIENIISAGEQVFPTEKVIIFLKYYC